MAKRKGSIALFEVINRDKGMVRPGGALTTPNWWFKGRAVKAEPVSPTAVAAPVAKSAARGSLVTPPQSPLPSPQGAHPHGTPPAYPVPPTHRRINLLERWQFALPPRWMKQISPQQYALVAGSLLVVMALAIGAVHWMHRPTGAAAVLAGAAHPEVLNVGASRPQQAGNFAPRPAATAIPAAAVQARSRQNNVGYVLIHLYPSQTLADQMCKYFNDHQINCTVEHGPGLAAQMYAVVGLEPFAKTGTAEYGAYIQQVKSLFVKFPGAVQSAKVFKPQLVKFIPPQSAGQAG